MSKNELSAAGLEIFLPDLSTEMPLQYADDGIRAGFPDSAQEYITETIDLNKDLIRHPAATFYGRVVGDSMTGDGIDDGDIIVIDRSLQPEDGDLAVCCLDGEFTLKRIQFAKDDTLLLVPSNPRYPVITVTEENQFTIWGIVSYTIKRRRSTPL